MINTNRRQAQRLPAEGLAYVNLEPDNGGVVLNISEGGLCFRSSNPVRETTTIRFWFSGRSCRMTADGRLAWVDESQKKVGSRFIEAESELAWTDATRKLGGLRFTNLSADAREEIRDWISEHATLAAVDKKSAPSFPSARHSSLLNPTRQDTNPTHRGLATVALPSLDIQAPRVLNGFSGGLVTGVIVALLVGGAFFLQLRSRDVGDALVHFGQRLGGKAPPPPASPVSNPSAVVQPTPADVPSASSALPPSSPAQTSVLRAEKSPSTPSSTAKLRELKLQIAAPAAMDRFTSGSGTSSVVPKNSLIPFSAPVPVVAITPFSPSASDGLRSTASPAESAGQPVVNVERSVDEGTKSPVERYLEIGNFNDRRQADITSDKLSQLGFRATLVNKSVFWRKSYQLLVGPYAGEPEAEVAHKNLESKGFSPRSFERGTRDFTLNSSLRLEGKHIPVGDCVISWESYVPDAIVKILGGDRASVTIQGKWVKRDIKYEDDAVVYTKNPDGTRTLHEFRFSGMRQALVFPQAK
jgi:cell division septation protein DedD